MNIHDVPFHILFPLHFPYIPLYTHTHIHTQKHILTHRFTQIQNIYVHTHTYKHTHFHTDIHRDIPHTTFYFKKWVLVSVTIYLKWFPCFSANTFSLFSELRASTQSLVSLVAYINPLRSFKTTFLKKFWIGRSMLCNDSIGQLLKKARGSLLQTLCNTQPENNTIIL